MNVCFRPPWSFFIFHTFVRFVWTHLRMQKRSCAKIKLQIPLFKGQKFTQGKNAPGGICVKKGKHLSESENVKVCFLSLIHSAFPKSLFSKIPIFIIAQNKTINFEVSIVIATGEIVGLAEWIIDDTCLVLVVFFNSCFAHFLNKSTHFTRI